MSSTRSLISFTSGLDSTYVLHEELKKGHNVEVVYASVAQGDDAKLAEITCRRRILEHFKQKFPEQIKEEWIVPTIMLNVSQRGYSSSSSSRPQLVQQTNTMLALIQVMLFSEVDYYRPMTGWHYQDVLENDPNELMTEDGYRLLKSTFKPMVRMMDPKRHVVCDLLTPAWDVEKFVMWESLDDWTQANLCLDYFYSIENRAGLNMMMQGMATPKFREYRKFGFSVGPGVHASYGLLSNLDRFYLARSATDNGNGIITQCREDFKRAEGYSTLDHAVSTQSISSFMSKLDIFRTTLLKLAPSPSEGTELKLVSNN